MKKIRKLSPIWVFVALLAVIAPIVLFSSKLKPAEGNLSPTKWLSEFLYPLEYTYNSIHTSISLQFKRLSELNKASIENLDLREEVNNLKLQQINYEELRQENKQLKELLEFKADVESNAVAVQLYSGRRDDLFQLLRSDKGQFDGLAVGMPVVTPRGILGRVIRTGLKHSDIQLLTDPNFHVDVLIQRTRTRAVLRGAGNGKCHLQLHNRSLVKIGDVVVTSGIVGSFPKGLPVGRITKISYGNDQISQQIELQTWVQPHNEEFALVLRRFDPSIEGIVESTTEDWLERNTTSQRNGGG